MKIWFISPASEYEDYNDSEPGETDYQYETDYEPLFCEGLYATEQQAISKRNEKLLESYEKERKGHETRLARHNARQEAIDLLILAGVNPEDLFPYGIGDKPEFSFPNTWRIGYLEVEE